MKAIRQLTLLEISQMMTPITPTTRMTPVQTPALKISAITSQPVRAIGKLSRRKV
jgi:hypothetical protein